MLKRKQSLHEQDYLGIVLRIWLGEISCQESPLCDQSKYKVFTLYKIEVYVNMLFMISQIIKLFWW
jgi:hypothetical protein